MTEKRFTVEKIEIVSDHRSTRFYIKDNLEDKSYDVQHIVSEEFEVQFDSWADAICDKWNNLNDENEQLREIKERYDETIVEWNALKSKYDDLKNENKQLKQELKYYKAMVHTDISKR